MYSSKVIAVRKLVCPCIDLLLYIYIVKQLPSYWSITLFADMEFQGNYYEIEVPIFCLIIYNQFVNLLQCRKSDGHTENFNTCKTLQSMIPKHAQKEIAVISIYSLPIILNHTSILMNHHFIEFLQKMLCQPYNCIINLILMIINWN